MKLLVVIGALMIINVNFAQERPVHQVAVNIPVTDTVIKLTIHSAKLKEFERRGISLEKTASKLINDYQFKKQNTKQNKTIARIEYPNKDIMKVTYSDGASKSFDLKNSGSGEKADNVNIEYPDPPPVDSPLDRFVRGVNNRLGETLASLLSPSVLSDFKASEKKRGFTIYQQMSQRVDLITSLKKK
jgi:hypothetical protein